MNKRFINEAIKEALKSTHIFKIGAVIFDKNKIISRGHNYSCKSVKSYNTKFVKWKGSIHAEVDAIIKARKPLKGLSILVIRINKNGKLGLAKPCKNCTKYINHVGIRKVFYSDNNEIRR